MKIENVNRVKCHLLQQGSKERIEPIHDGASEGSYVGANASANEGEGAGAGAAGEGIPGSPMATHALLHFFSHWFSDTKSNGMHCLMQSP